MSSCENCFKRDIKPDDIRVHEFPNGEKVLIGPCCIGEQIRMEPALDYHFELSSKNGVVASVEYAGLKLEYKRSPEQLRETFAPADAENVAVH